MDSRGPSVFNPDGEASAVSMNWTRWIEEFEAFADSKGLFNLAGNVNANLRAQRKALLLYHAGPRVREIHSNLPDTARDEYTQMVEHLTGHFHVAPNATFQRHLFRKSMQQNNETVSQYCARLRTLGAQCAFPDLDNQIRDQIVETCISDKLREKLLEQGNNLTLAILLTTAATHEAVTERSKEMNTTCSINRAASGIGSTQKPYSNRNNRGRQTRHYTQGRQTQHNQNAPVANNTNACTRCGTKHQPRECPAFGKTCHACKKKNHFKKMCNQNKRQKAYTVTANNMSESDTETPGYAFHIPYTKCKSGKLEHISLKIGQVKTDFIVDTGADCNIMSQNTYEYLKSRKFKVHNSVRGGPQIIPYMSESPIKPIGQFWTDIETMESGKHLENVKFTVIPGKADSLLGIDTAKELGIVKFIANVLTIDDYEKQFPRLFSNKLGKSDVEIKLTIRHDIMPVAQPPRRVALPLRDKLEHHLQELVKQDIIEPVEDHQGSSWVSPIVIVPKKNNDIRLCIDMRRANEAIVRHQHPVPTVDEMLHEMNGAQYFSKLDLKMGFHQFVLAPESRDITTFSTHVGLFRYKRLMFGINAAPEIYQKEISKIIRGLQGVASLADDILVHGRTRDEHDQRLAEVFRRLEKANMTLNKDKCQIGVQKIQFLGHTISCKGIDPDKEKVEAVREASKPKTVSEMKSFLGLTSYLSKFIPHYSHSTEPLRRLIVGKSPRESLQMNKEELSAFQSLKDALSNSKTLAHFDLKNDTVLFTDASPKGLGAVLMQRQDGEMKVISYGSRALTPVEQRYLQVEREALAIAWACEKFHHYLFGCRFKVITDCKPLETIYGNINKRTSLRIERWQLRLQSYDFEIEHIKGENNIADAMSRLINSKEASEHLEEKENTELYVRNTVISMSPSAVTPRTIEEVSFSDVEIQNVKYALKSGSFSNKDVPAIYKSIQAELCVVGELLLRGNRIIIPKQLRSKILEIAHEGHSGIVGTKRYLRTCVWWPGMDSDVERLVKRCHECQLTSKPCDRMPIRVTDLPNGPWEDLAIDILGPLDNNTSVIVLVDYYSRWVEVKFARCTKANTIITWLKQVFETHGIPISIKSDNGPQFKGAEFENFCETLAIRHDLTTPRWPEANGEVERQNRTIMKRVQIARSTGISYEQAIRSWLFTHRNTPHSITGKSPAEMLFGRKLRTKLPNIQCLFQDLETRDRDSELKNSMVSQKNEKLQRGGATNIKVGDQVLVLRDNPSKCQTPFHDNPFTVIDIKGSQVTVKSVTDQIYKRNITFIRPYCSPLPFVVGEDMTDPHSQLEQSLERETPAAVDNQIPVSNPETRAEGSSDNLIPILEAAPSNPTQSPTDSPNEV